MTHYSEHFQVKLFRQKGKQGDALRHTEASTVRWGFVGLLVLILFLIRFCFIWGGRLLNFIFKTFYFIFGEVVRVGGAYRGTGDGWDWGA